MKFGLILMPKWEALGGENHVFSQDSCKKQRFQRFRNFMKSGKSMKIGASGAQGPVFYDFGFFGGARFLVFFGSATSRPKIRKNPTFWRRKSKTRASWGRPGGMRGATGEVRRGPNLSGFGKFGYRKFSNRKKCLARCGPS